ncbi:MAG: F0F1 ATP synthase subunit delta [Balneola sp.]|jgi:F-type H+-transporting ATPase subunit delta|nr:F0F1 ATP synthase subunit delta [Balneola sp.]MBE79870.1 F0F1 ATP synthase subunit delta [Balneola sp.]HBX66949.1 F0F1 ATP synthase subunit delta [Balneolaceae bacterium]|tara:strand:+ start:181 stop:729 length:549 start_codon:yes stop_codon:yes gene_type:complete
MLVSKAARRYATALLELAKEQDVVESTLEDILFVKTTLEDSRDLVLFLKSPIIKPDKKVSALEEIFKSEISELVHRFITLIARKNRQNVLDEIVTAFVEVYNEYAGIISAEVFVATKLDDKQIAAVTEKLEEVTGKKVNVTIKVQEDLKGGMAIKIADTVIDGTVKHQLEQLEDVFLNTTTE